MTSPTTIDEPTEAENKAALKDFFGDLAKNRKEMQTAAIHAKVALARLCQMLGHRTGQSYKIRSLLFSMWNGKEASLAQVLDLDWAVRKDLCAVILAFGFEYKDEKFFYDWMQNALKAEGQFEWFLEASESEVAA